MKYIKNIIIALFIIIVIVILLLLFINKKEIDIAHEDSYENNADTTNIDTNIKEVDNITLYYTVKDCLDKFYKTVIMEIASQSEGDYIEGGEISYSQLTGLTSNEDKNQAIYDQLYVGYVQKNNITKTNVYEKIRDIGNSFLIDKMYIIDGENIKDFYVYIENNEKKEKIFEVILDVNNNTYSINPLNNVNYNEITAIDVDSINKNSNNAFNYANISDEQMAKNYFYDFKNNVLSDISKSYNKLEENYKKKRFENIDNYKEYVNNNQNELQKIIIKKYLINNYQDYTEYVCQDQYENYYIFRAKNVMNYEVLLDNYTITTDKFKETYSEANNEKKVQMNVDKFIQMINRHDYKTSYNCISSGFKKNYLDTQEKFEEYMKNIFFEYNKFEFRNIEQKGSNLYTVTLNITDLTEESSETRNVTIIMQLNDDLDFEMSFGIE